MSRRLFIAGILFLTTVLIVIDVFFFKSDHHFEFAYCLIVTISIWYHGRNSTLAVGVISSLIIITRYIARPSVSLMSDGELTSLIIPLGFIWAFVYVVLLYKNELIKSNIVKERLSAMFNNATEGIIISNEKGEILMINPKAESMFGYDSGELNEKIIEVLVPGKIATEHQAYRTDYIASPKSRPMGHGRKLNGRKKDNSDFPVEVSLSTFKIKDDLYIISFIIDATLRRSQEEAITRANEDLESRVIERTKELAFVNASLKAEINERLNVELALRNSERMYNVMASNFPNGFICILNRDYKCVFIDGTELSKFNITREEAEGTTLLTSRHLPLNEEARNSLAKVFEWKSAAFDINQNKEIYSVTAVPLPGEKGFINEILLVVRNVTERRQIETELKETIKKERELNDLKSKFVSIASHEFRTPLSTILSSVTLIEKYDKPDDIEKKNKHVERIKSSVKNLTEILNDFLSLEKLEAGKIDVRPSSFDIAAFAKDLCEEMQVMTRSGQQIIYMHQGNGKMVTLDQQLLRNICINMLNNAIKYSPDGSPVEFTTRTGKDVVISIKDHGLGIPAEDQQHLFERFFRASNVTAIQGTGLGLNIVNRYINLMHGKMQFNSKENIGSEFIISFPIEKEIS